MSKKEYFCYQCGKQCNIHQLNKICDDCFSKFRKEKEPSDEEFYKDKPLAMTGLINIPDHIDILKQVKKRLIGEFLDDYDIFYDTLLRIKESRESKRTRGVIPEVACILEEEIHSYSKEGYRRDKWEAKRRDE